MKALKGNWITVVLELSTVIAAMQLNGTLQVTHEKNLIWSQRDEASSVSRLVGVSGDPDHWIPTHVALSRYITAPGSAWKFLALTFDYRRRQLLWADSGNNRIQGFYLNGSNQPYDIYTGTSNRVEGIAVDWLRGNLYWSDSVYNWIGMTTTSPGEVDDVHRIIMDTGLDEPHDIVVDPIHRKLFWSDTGVVAKIETSDLTGMNRKILVFTGLSQPAGLTYDVEGRTLYWVDRALHRVESIESDGKKRRLLVEDTGSTFRAITTYGDYIFLTEQGQKQLIVYKKSTGEREISFSMNGAMPYDVIMYDPSKQRAFTVHCQSDTCDHMCTEDETGEPVCICSEGYKLEEDGSTCVAQQTLQPPQIIYTIGTAVCSFPANIPDISIDTISLDKYCILTDQNTTALTFSIKEQVLYLYDSFTKTISKVRLTAGKRTQVLHVMRNVGTHVSHMAFDWVALNLYWIDEVNNRVMVTDHMGESLVALIEDLDSPRALAVDAVSRKLFWSVTGTNPAIQTSALDGSDRRNLVTEDVLYPSHISVDYVSYRLYWCDTQLGRIEWSSFDGTIRQTIISQPGGSFSGLTVFQDFVLWTETGSSNGLHVAYKDTGEKIRGVIHPKVGQAGSVLTYDKSSQPSVPENPCDENTCHQVCIPVDSNTYKCVCGLGYVLDDTGQTCKTEPFSDNFLMFTDYFQKSIYQLSLDTLQIRALAIPNVGQPHALTFDPIDQRIYWTDVTYKLIKTARLDGGDDKVMAILNKDSIPDGIAVAAQSRLIYYTDGGIRLIGVMDTSGQYHVTLIKHRLHKPRAIAVYEDKGLIFWTDWGRRSRIERADMSGGSRKQIISTGTGSWPNGLTVDTVSERIYWCDARQRLIESADLDGRDRRILARIPKSHMFTLTRLENELYYSDWRKRSIMQMKVTDQKATVQAIGPAKFTKINGIDSYRKSQIVFTGMTVCGSMTQKCSHMCIPIATKAVCRCPDGIKMSQDGYHCITDKWLTNAAPFIIPTPSSSTEDMKSHVTTKPSLLNKYNKSGHQQTIPTLNNTRNIKNHLGRHGAKDRIELTRYEARLKGKVDENPLQVNNNEQHVDRILHQTGDKQHQPEDIEAKTKVNSSPELKNVDNAKESQSVSPTKQTDRTIMVSRNTEPFPVETTTTIEITGTQPSNYSETDGLVLSWNMSIAENRTVNGALVVKDNVSDSIVYLTETAKDESFHTGITLPNTLSPENVSATINITSTAQPSTLSNAHEESINMQTKVIQQDEPNPGKQPKVPTVIAFNNSNQEFKIKTIIANDDPYKHTTKIASKSYPFSTTEELQHSDIDGSPVFSGTTKREMLGLLLTVCVAAILVCASLTCCVLCYNKVLKKKRKNRASTEVNSHQQESELSKTYNRNRFELATTTAKKYPRNTTNKATLYQAPSPMYASPKLNNTAKIATIRIKSSGKQRHYSKKSKVFATEVTKKYASMSDSEFTGDPGDFRNQANANLNTDNYSYQPDSGSDFSFDTDVESNNVPDFVTFKYGHDSHV